MKPLLSFAVLFLAAGLPCGAQAQAPASAPAPWVEPYLRIQQALAHDTLEGVPAAAAALAEAAKPGGALPPTVAVQARAVGAAQTLDAARAAFKPLSASLLALAKAAPKDGSLGVSEAYCPMVQASWLQAGKKISNPYEGNAMAECGVVRGSY